MFTLCRPTATNLTALILLLFSSAFTGAQVLPVAYWQKTAGPATIVQKASNFAGASSLALAYPSSLTAGNIIIACATSALSATTISDSNSNSWTLQQRVNAGSNSSTCWSAKAKAGASTVTVSNAGAHVVVTLLEISGEVSIERSGGATNSGATASASTTAPVDDPNSYVIGYAADWDNYVTWVPTTPGMTIIQQGQVTGGKSITVIAGALSKGYGIKSATFTKDFPGDAWSAIVMTLRPTITVPRIVQQTSVNIASGTSIAATFPNPVTAGNMILACMTMDNFAGISDNRNGAYGGLSSSGKLKCTYFFNAAGGSTTVTATASPAASKAGMAIFEVSGSLSTVVQEFWTSNNGTTSVTLNTGAFSPPTQFAFIFGGSYWTSTDPPTNFTASSNVTIRHQLGQTTSKYSCIWADLNEKRALGSSLAITVNATDVQDFFGIQFASFK